SVTKCVLKGADGRSCRRYVSFGFHASVHASYFRAGLDLARGKHTLLAYGQRRHGGRGSSAAGKRRYGNEDDESVPRAGDHRSETLRLQHLVHRPRRVNAGDGSHPEGLCPPPRIATSTPFARAYATAAITSAVSMQRAIAPGRLSFIAL